jgi:EH domain-containing protein 1
MQELTSVPQKSCDRKVNEIVKRVRALKVHLLLIQHLKKEMPAVAWNKAKKQTKILDKMPDHFRTVRAAQVGRDRD